MKKKSEVVIHAVQHGHQITYCGIKVDEQTSITNWWLKVTCKECKRKNL